MRKITIVLSIFLVCMAVSAENHAQTTQGIQVLQASVFTDQTNYALGDFIQINLNLSVPSYAYIFEIDATSRVVQLFPNAYSQDNFLQAGATLLPDTNAYEFVASQPAGDKFIQLIVAQTPINLGSSDFAQPFPELSSFNDFQNQLSQISSQTPIVLASTQYSTVAPSVGTPQNPVATFNYLPSSPNSGQLIELDASASFDPDGTITEYRWDLTGDGVPDVNGAQISTGATEGQFDITLFVTDNSGQISTRTKSILVQQVANQSPTAIFSSNPTQPISGEPVLFDASGSRDLDGNIISYLWDFQNDGQIDASGRQVMTRFNAGGIFQVALTVVDNLGASNTRTQLIIVGQQQANSIPTANFTITPFQPRVGELVTLDATSSFDSDGFIVNYEWDVDGNGVVDFNGPVIRIRFNNPGTAILRLTVRDNAGGVGITQQQILVLSSEQPPQASFTFSPANVIAGQTVIFDASTSTDPDGFISQYQWDFQGDGVTDLSGRRVATRFNTAGTFQVILTVTDNSGNSASTQQFIQVGQGLTPPVASFTITPSPAAPNQTVFFDASSSFDPDGFITQYQWDFQSDGIIDATGRQVSVSFNTTGTANVSLTVTDNDGLTAVSRQLLEVSQPNTPPTASFTATPSPAIVNQVVFFDATGSFDPDGFVAEYRWDFQSDGVIDRTGSQVNFQFSSIGNFQVTLTVLDDQGATSSISQNITVTAIPPDPNALDVIWTIPVGVSVSGNSLTKTGNSGWNAGAVSSRQLVSGDGYIETTVTSGETQTSRIFGFSNTNPDADRDSIQYGIFLLDGGRLRVRESGVDKFMGGTYNNGDILRVEISGSDVLYKLNGVTFFVTPGVINIGSYPLIVDVSIFDTGATISNARVRGDLITTPPSPPDPNAVDVIWSNPVGVSVSGNNLTKTGSSGWNAGAVSSLQIVIGDGYVETTVTTGETQTNRIFGLSNINPDAGRDSIQYGIFLLDGGRLRVRESGVDKFTGGVYNSGDVLRVEVSGSDVLYKINGFTFFITSGVINAASFPLIADASLFDTGATLSNARIRGNLAATPPPADPGAVDVIWLNTVGVSVSGNNLAKTGGSGWNAGAVSAQQFVSGDGYVETTVATGETQTSRIFGLSNTDPDAGRDSIQYGIFLLDGGRLRVRESGTDVFDGGTYDSGDVLRVEISGTDILYKKNGVTFFTTPGVISVASYPLIVDSSLFDTGATITNARVNGTITVVSTVQSAMAVENQLLFSVAHSANSLTNSDLSCIA